MCVWFVIFLYVISRLLARMFIEIAFSLDVQRRVRMSANVFSLVNIASIK